MIELSSREKEILNNLINELDQEGCDLALVNEHAGRDLSEIEQAIIKDILKEYLD